MPTSDRSTVSIARRVLVALGVGLALLASALGVVLSGSPVSVIGTNSIVAEPNAAVVSSGFHTCQMSGLLPSGTTAIRISASANTGPRVTLTVRSGGRLITSGERDAGWGVDKTLTVPVKRVSRTVARANVCIAFGPVIEGIEINGTPTHRTTPGASGAAGVLLRFEYLRALHSSWWSRASSVARRMGYEHAPSGTWVVFVLIAAMIAVVALASRLALRELR